MNENQEYQIAEFIRDVAGERDSLVHACRWMYNEPPEGEERHCSLLMPLVPDPAPHEPDMHAASLSFAARVKKAIDERFGGNAPSVYKRAGVLRQTYSMMEADETVAVSKRTAIRFAFALGMDLAGAEALLKSAGYALSDSIAEDVILKACLSAEPPVHDFNDVNRLMAKYGVEACY